MMGFGKPLHRHYRINPTAILFHAKQRLAKTNYYNSINIINTFLNIYIVIDKHVPTFKLLNIISYKIRITLFHIPIRLTFIITC